MKKVEGFFKKIFLVAALYDLILGILFLFFYESIFNYFNITLPVYPMYLQMSAAFVIAMGVGYYFVYLNMYRNADLVKLGITYKISYAGLAIYFYFVSLANVVFFWLALVDVIFLILFFKFLSHAKNDGRYLKWH